MGELTVWIVFPTVAKITKDILKITNLRQTQVFPHVLITRNISLYFNIMHSYSTHFPSYPTYEQTINAVSSGWDTGRVIFIT